MALKGLTFTIWVGWVCGVLVLKRPWGSPTFPSWFTFSTFYCLLGLLMYLFLMADFFLNNSGGLTMGDEHQFGKYVRAFMLVQYIVVTLMKRLTFLFNAKKLGRLLELLSEYDEGCSRGRKEGRKRLWIVPLLIYGSFAIAMVRIVGDGVEFVMENASKPSWLKMVGLGEWGYGVVNFIYAVIPLGIVSNVAYSFILVTSLHVSRIFCDFCRDVKDSLPMIISKEGLLRREDSSLEIYSILKMGSKADWERKKNGIAVGRNRIGCLTKAKLEKKSSLDSLRCREDVIDKFEEMKELLRLTNETLSCLLLWMITGMTLGMVANASQLFVTGNNSSGINLVTDILTFPLLGMYALLLELGYKIGRMQRAAKLELHKELLRMPWSVAKEEMEDVVQEIVQWEWKLSACGFFVVDRALASGIFSLVLNYVVILVQLNIALTEDPPIVCSKNGTIAESNATINQTSSI